MTFRPAGSFISYPTTGRLWPQRSGNGFYLSGRRSDLIAAVGAADEPEQTDELDLDRP